MKLLAVPDSAQVRRQTHIFEEDFDHYVDADLWTVVATDSGTAAIQSAAGGTIKLTASDGTVADNDECYLHSAASSFQVAAGKPLQFKASAQYAEANTSAANVFIGLVSGVSANCLVDDGGGLKTSFSGFAFVKVDGGTVWKVVSSNGSTQTVHTTRSTAGGSAFHEFQIDVDPLDATTAYVTFKIDGAPVVDSTSGLPIRHLYTFTGAVTMQLAFGVKNGSATNESVTCDYIECYQAR